MGWAVFILLCCLALLFAEALHCKVLDWLEWREVSNAWQGCQSIARISVPKWSSDRARRREAEELFKIQNQNRMERGKSRLPSHLLGVPAAELIRRHA